MSKYITKMITEELFRDDITLVVENGYGLSDEDDSDNDDDDDDEDSDY